MQEVGFEEVEACVLRSQNTAARHIAMRLIMDLYKKLCGLQGYGQ